MTEDEDVFIRWEGAQNANNEDIIDGGYRILDVTMIGMVRGAESGAEG